jgi:hypothetical protein
MRQGQGRGFGAAAKGELWDRWQRGESLKAIGRAFDKPSSSIYFQLAAHGGIQPASRRRSKLALTLVEREEISHEKPRAPGGSGVIYLVKRDRMVPDRIPRGRKPDGGCVLDRNMALCIAYKAAAREKPAADVSVWSFQGGKPKRKCRVTMTRIAVLLRAWLTSWSLPSQV